MQKIEKAIRERPPIETLIHKLKEYSLLHDGNLIEWDDANKPKYAIAYKNTEDCFVADPHNDFVIGTVYFKSKSIAAKAIVDIVMPFIKEHPDLTW